MTLLDGPAVVLISTHGTKKGIEVAGQSIAPAVITDALRPAHNVELLHLSGCSMMRGNTIRKIIDRRADSDAAQFPISGYTTPVAWDASAISDFTFLSFILIHRLAPRAALQQTHRNAPFTADQAIADGHYAPLGLTLAMPPPTETDSHR